MPKRIFFDADISALSTGKGMPMSSSDSSLERDQLWPPISAFRQGSLIVSEIHTIHYALYGNPHGSPLFFLHGGPGGGCDDDDARWFDPQKYLIITHDQRGSGKSRPLAEIKDNTPQDLVNDIESLRTYLHIQDSIDIFAGSWGTTLALLYAETYPDHVSRMMLRGIFTCGWEAQDYLYSEKGAARFSPKAWEVFISKIPAGPVRIQECLYRLLENSDEKSKKRWRRIIAEYEYSFFNMPVADLEASLANTDSIHAEMRINTFYQANRFFLQDDQILNNANLINHIPVTIIHGSRDVICPPELAWKLHCRLPKSELIMVPGGEHVASDPRIQKALLKALKNWCG
jgi:proline iminopeptidase